MEKRIRPSAIAGTWYPDDPQALARLIDGLLEAACPPEVPERPWGLVAPHAGYVYSGLTAAHAYRLLRDCDIRRVVILSPLHHWAVGDYFTAHATHYRTPLGEVPIHRGAVEALSGMLPIVELDHDQEHSLEIQLPFLQRVLKDFTLLPLMLGLREVRELSPLVEALSNLEGYDQALWIASSDLHHESDYRAVVQGDGEVIGAFLSGSVQRFSTRVSRPDCTVCGRVPMTALLRLAEKKGHARSALLHRINSGDITGEKERGSYTVGYMAAALW